jgi:hypothetical protein
MNPKYICSYCGKSTYEVDIDYLSGYDHLSCVISNSRMKRKLEISNWDKLVGNKFDIMGASFIISVAHADSSNKGDVYTAWVHGENDTEPFVRVTLFADNMDMQVKVLPPMEYDTNMTPYDLTSTITKNHISNPSIFIQTIAEALLSDPTTRDILSYVSREQDSVKFRSGGASSSYGLSGSSGNNLW